VFLNETETQRDTMLERGVSSDTTDSSPVYVYRLSTFQIGIPDAWRA
jgi:hypothetical protein